MVSVLMLFVKRKAIYVWGGNKVFNGSKFELVKFQLFQ